MNTSNLDKLENEVKSLNDYWRGLSPEERRAAVIQFRDTQLRTSRQSAIVIFVFGLISLTATLFLWQNQYHRSTMSSLGIVVGAVVAGLGFRYMQSNRVKSYNRLFSDDFSDEDILAWMKEHEEVNRRAREQLSGWGKYLVLVVGGTWIIMLLIDATQELAFTATASALTVVFWGLSTFFIVTNYSTIKKNKKPKS